MRDAHDGCSSAPVRAVSTLQLHTFLGTDSVVQSLECTSGARPRVVVAQHPLGSHLVEGESSKGFLSCLRTPYDPSQAKSRNELVEIPNARRGEDGNPGGNVLGELDGARDHVDRR